MIAFKNLNLQKVEKKYFFIYTLMAAIVYLHISEGF